MLEQMKYFIEYIFVKFKLCLILDVYVFWVYVFLWFSNKSLTNLQILRINDRPRVLIIYTNYKYMYIHTCSAFFVHFFS